MFTSNNLKIFLISSLVYLLAVIFVYPIGNYGIGDDIYYIIQLEAFQNGIFIKNAHIDTSIILQIFISQIWTYFFEISFQSLRILTIIFTLAIILILMKIFEEIKVPEKFSYLGIFLIIFNLKFFHYSLSFNSEIYFIFFMLLSTLFLIKFTKAYNFKFYYFASLFAGLSICIRQVGILLLIPLLFVFLNKKNFEILRFDKFKILTGVSIFIIFALVGIFWPKEVSQFQENSQNIFGVIDFERITEKISLLWYEIPYMLISLIPFTFVMIKHIDKLKFQIILILLSIIFGFYFYTNNIFSIGNLIYIEGISSSSYTKIRDHIFNNLPTKLIFAFFLGLVLSGFILFIIKRFFLIKLDLINQILMINFIIFFLSILLADVYYDRYFLFSEIYFLIFIIKIFSVLKLEFDFFTYIFILLIFFITTLYTFDYHQLIKRMWNLSEDISKTKDIDNEKIFINDNYLKFQYMNRIKDFRGLKPNKPINPKYNCFVISGEDFYPNQFSLLIYRIEKYLRKIDFVPLKKIDNSYTAGQVKSCSSCKVLFQEQIYSPIYNFFGKSLYIKAYCLDEKK